VRVKPRPRSRAAAAGCEHVEDVEGLDQPFGWILIDQHAP